ncbi:hypothetical protein E2C01_005731 [Portunus trituberculatus]|uniref:Uncharacterized protein n=1 Tax=Portunus trituberculatus TaxID=210409 RepID=A0A5B7CTG2_PORTR|nr:hypothetical protein [Portunus trituberculatus]
MKEVDECEWSVGCGVWWGGVITPEAGYAGPRRQTFVEYPGGPPVWKRRALARFPHEDPEYMGDSPQAALEDRHPSPPVTRGGSGPRELRETHTQSHYLDCPCANAASLLPATRGVQADWCTRRMLTPNSLTCGSNEQIRAWSDEPFALGSRDEKGARPSCQANTQIQIKGEDTVPMQVLNSFTNQARVQHHLPSFLPQYEF